jgi:hypothetical protein
MLLLSSFQTLAFSITTKDVSTPEGTAAVINLNINDSSEAITSSAKFSFFSQYPFYKLIKTSIE